MSSPSWRSSSLRKERDWWSADLEGEMEKVEGSFSVTAGGSMDPERKADHWSTRTVLTKEESEGVKQGMDVDEVIPGMQASNNETDGGSFMCEVGRTAARVEVQPQKKSDTCGMRRNARLRT